MSDKKCGCGIFVTCDYHSAEYDRLDQEIDNRYLKRAAKVNRLIEKNVADAEGYCITKLDKIICILVILFFLWLATK